MGFSEVQEAIDAIGRLGMAVVVDDEDRENEGDLVMAAEAATPENIAFFLAHTSGVICVPLLPERADKLELPADGHGQHRGPAHRLHRERRLPPRHHDGHLGHRPRRHHRRPDRSLHPAHRPEPARAHLPVALPRRRRAQAGRAHRGDRRPGPGRRPHPGRSPVRDRDRGQVGDGAAARARALRQEARSAHHLHRRADPLPAPQREAGAPGLRGPHPGRGRPVPGLRLRVRARRRAASRPRHGRGRRPGGRAGPGALRVPDRRRLRLPALRLRPPAAGIAGPDRGGGPRRARSTCAATRAAASGSATRSAPTSCRKRGTTRSTPTCSRACRWTAASTASGPRCWSTSA